MNAALAWAGFALVVVLSAVGAYRDEPPTGHTYGIHPDGLAGVLSRVADTASYFTEWSNVVVALSLTLLAVAPERDTPWRRVLRLDALLMITVTAIVYAVLLAPTMTVEGWSRLTNPWQHILVPAVTVLVWLVWGPRGWITGRTVLASLGIPLLWVVFMLARAAATGAYPYGFVDVRTLGVPAVARTLVMILAFGLTVASLYWGLDTLLSRVGRGSGSDGGRTAG